MVDSEGFVLGIFVTAANLSDQQGLFGILDNFCEEHPKLSKIWADTAYQGVESKSYCRNYGIELEVVKREASRPGFEVQKHRWVVERTFAWIGRQKHISK